MAMLAAAAPVYKRRIAVARTHIRRMPIRGQHNKGGMARGGGAALPIVNAVKNQHRLR